MLKLSQDPSRISAEPSYGNCQSRTEVILCNCQDRIKLLQVEILAE
jgi:hypothetical protein